MPKVKLIMRPFQNKGVRTIQHFKGVSLLADEMGLGKTIQALAYLKNHPKKLTALIVTPAHLKWLWEGEARSKFGMRTTVLSGMTPKRIKLGTSRIFIINYDILKGWFDVLVKLNLDCIIFDECHYCKNRSAKRTKFMKRLLKDTPHRIALSGTPLTNRPSELFPAINMLWPEAFPNFHAFAQRYCRPVLKPWGWEYKGATHLDELHRRLLKLGMIRRRKADVLKDLPPKQRQVVPLDIPLDDYNEAKNNFLDWLGKQSLEKARKASAAEQIVKLGYLKRLASTEKLPLISKWIEDYLESTNEKLVVFGIHKAIVRGLYDQFKKISVCLDGSTPSKKRKEVVKKFQTNKGTRLFFGNIQAAGTGITLTAASRLVFVEMDWVPGNHTQAEDRIHRIGQDQKAEIIYMVAKGTIEEQLCNIIQSKQEVVSQTLDGNESIENLNIFKMLTDHLKGKA